MNAPKRGKKYQAVLDAGCGGYSTWTDWGYEYDCEHEYEWDCDYCPIVVEQRKAEYLEEEERLKSIKKTDK